MSNIKEIYISKNCLPPTILVIREYTYSLKFGGYEIPFSTIEAEKLIEAIKNNPLP